MADIHLHTLAPSRARSGEDPLVPFLLSARGNPVTLSMRNVARIDTHRLQLILVAQRQWAMDARPFQVTDMTPSFHDGLERLGLPADHFEKELSQ